MMNKDLVDTLPEILKIASQNKFGIAGLAILCIAILASMLLNQKITIQKRRIYLIMCTSIMAITALVFIEMLSFHPISSKEKVSKLPLPISQSTSGSQSPIQNNRNGDNNYNSAEKR